MRTARRQYFSSAPRGRDETERYPICRDASRDAKYCVSITNDVSTNDLSTASADTAALERQIDEMVYALYGLTEEEIKVVEGKK